jgi:type IV pilus assembly protein PilB
MSEPRTTLHPIIKTLIQHKLLNEEAAKGIMLKKGYADRNIIISLAESGDIPDYQLLNFLSERYGIPQLNLDCVEFDPDIIKKVDYKLLARHLVIPLSQVGKSIYVAVADPTNFSVIEDIKFQTNMDVVVILASAIKIARVVEKMATTIQGKLDDMFGAEAMKVATDEDEVDFDAIEDSEDTLVIRMVQQIFMDAIHRGVSDIHIEPYEKEMRVRYRQDGVLTTILQIPNSVKDAMTSRLKILCRLDIAERRLPQDGRLRIRVNPQKAIDFRVSFLPTAFGETIVLRLLDPSSSKVPIENLGFLPEQRELFERAIKKPYGMILVTGPTGSGKTTTLYTALNMLNDGEVNISTVEDPIEIPVYGINQVNVNEKIGFTFASALRSFLRQDPDILMVGEIRDLETAETAIKAAQTGHLVLATLHTNDAPQTLTRLENMGIPTYNIASAVLLVMAQRLARKLCVVCKKPTQIPEAALIEAGYNKTDLTGWRPYENHGCEACNGTGYKGRVGLYQVMPVSNAMKDLILRGGSAMDIEHLAAEEGILDMRKSGLLRVQEGLTSLEEVMRITTLS